MEPERAFCWTNRWNSPIPIRVGFGWFHPRARGISLEHSDPSPASRVHGLYEVKGTRLPGKPTAGIEFFYVVRAARFSVRGRTDLLKVDIETLKSSERLFLCTP